MSTPNRKPSPAQAKVAKRGVAAAAARPAKTAASRAFKSSAPAARQARLGVRLDPQMKALLQHAASLRGRSMTDFLLDSAVQAAERVIKDATLITLGMAEAERFVRAVSTPPRPNSALRGAARRYRELTQQ